MSAVQDLGVRTGRYNATNFKKERAMRAASALVLIQITFVISWCRRYFILPCHQRR